MFLNLYKSLTLCYNYSIKFLLSSVYYFITVIVITIRPHIHTNTIFESTYAKQDVETSEQKEQQR